LCKILTGTGKHAMCFVEYSEVEEWVW
jgi:hypothetical protein